MNAQMAMVTVPNTVIITLEVTGVPVMKATIWKATKKHVQVTINYSCPLVTITQRSNG